MPHFFKGPVVGLIGVVALVPAVFVAPAAQAGQIETFTIAQDSCDLDIAGLGIRGLLPSRDNTGLGTERIRFSVQDGSQSVLASFEHGGPLGPPMSFTIGMPLRHQANINPLKATAVSVAGNGHEELFLASAEVYCANLPGSIVTTPASYTFTDAADVSESLVPFVVELAGSSVTYSVIKSPESGEFNLHPAGSFTYQWGAARFLSFDVMVRNAAGQGQVLPVTLERSLSAMVVLTSSASAVTLGDPVSIAARLEATDAALPPTGTVKFTGEGDGQAWVEDLGAGGVASVDIENLPIGTHTLTASYSGDSNYAASVSEAVTVTVTAKEEPGTEGSECAEGESLNDEGACITSGTDGDGGDPDGGVKPDPLPDNDKKPVAQGAEKPAKTVSARIANTGVESSVWLAGASVLAIAAGVSLVARRRRA